MRPSKKPRLDAFRPLARNPNQHTAKGLGLLDAAMSRHGYVAPMTAAADGAILDGNARLETVATKFPGVTPIVIEHDGTRPIIAVRTDIASAADPLARDIIVTANRVAEADLAYDVAVLREFAADGLDLAPFEFDATFLAEITSGRTAGLTDPDDCPEVRPTSIVRGDLFELWRHRLLCGDSTVGADVGRLLGHDKPFLMVTDPPYGVDYDPDWRNDAAEKGLIAHAARRVGVVANDDRVDWSATWDLSPASVCYCWHAGRHAAAVQASLECAKFELRCQIIWAKSRFAISRGHYHWQHEPCWYAVRKGATAEWAGDRSQTTLWSVNLDKNVEGGHSTQKPVELMLRSIRNHNGDVYEPFGGSGTTMIAAEQLGRRCFALEIEPSYCQVIIDRWEAFTGQKATKVGEAVSA